MPPACVRPWGRRGSSLAGPVAGGAACSRAPAERVEAEGAEFSRRSEACGLWCVVALGLWPGDAAAVLPARIKTASHLLCLQKSCLPRCKSGFEFKPELPLRKTFSVCRSGTAQELMVGLSVFLRFLLVR